MARGTVMCGGAAGNWNTGEEDDAGDSITEVSCGARESAGALVWGEERWGLRNNGRKELGTVERVE